MVQPFLCRLARPSLAMQCQQCSVTLPALINLPFSHFRLIKNNYLHSRGLSHLFFFLLFIFFFFISYHNLLSHVDWHAGFMSFIALLTCNPIWFISQSLNTLVIPGCFCYRVPWPFQRYRRMLAVAMVQRQRNPGSHLVGSSRPASPG